MFRRFGREQAVLAQCQAPGDGESGPCAGTGEPPYQRATKAGGVAQAPLFVVAWDGPAPPALILTICIVTSVNTVIISI